jgi:uncharacterized protein (TIGR02421 family)
MGTTVSDREKSRIRSAARLIHEAARSLRILRSLRWPPAVKAEFFAREERELPRVSYEKVDPVPALEALREARRMIVPATPVDLWLERQADSVEGGARMLALVGTSAFFEYSRSLYGEPTACLRFYPTTSLELAQRVHDVIEQLDHLDLSIAPPSRHDAEGVKSILEPAVRRHFGDEAPAIEIADELSANALATSRRIRLRAQAQFTDRDAAQLLNHEAYVHVATSLNGRAQDDLPILGQGHPGTTRTQEGLAVFAELVSGTLELDRMRRLADRVIGIQMAIDGADFLDVYRFFLEQTGDRDQSFESARRIFRGGVMTGGAPFTKDVVYLYGLLQVSNAFRAIFAAGRADCLQLMFAGKLDVMDLPALCHLAEMGLCRLPRHLPPWARDPRFLMALLTYSSFINQIDMDPFVEAAERLLAAAPIVQARPMAAE